MTNERVVYLLLEKNLKKINPSLRNLTKQIDATKHDFTEFAIFLFEPDFWIQRKYQLWF